MRNGEETAVSQLVIRAFEESVAALYSAEGVAEFLRLAQPEAIRQRAEGSGKVFVAETDEGVRGVIEIRNRSHVLMLFVETAAQRQGIGRRLLDEAVAFCRRVNPELSEITVNSSPNAVTAYQRFGFVSMSPEKLERGIRFTPMKMRIL